VPVTPTFKKIEGESYLYELTYPSGTKGYAVRATRAGVPGKKQYFPFTKEGLAKAKKERDDWLIRTEKLTKELLKKGPIDPAIKKMANPPDPKKPWRYKRSESPDTYHATEQDAKDFQAKVKKEKYAANTKIPKTDFPAIKEKIIKGDTLEKIASSYDAEVDTVRTLLKDNGTTYSQLTPNVSYRKDKDLRKLLKKDYGKLSRKSLAEKLFPDLPIASASNKVATLVQDMIKDNEIKPIRRSEEVSARASTDAKNVKANIISKRRRKKLTGLGSRAYEDHLRNFKADLQKFLGLKPIVRKDGSKFYPIDMGHRADIDQLKALSRFGAKLNPTDLGPDYYRSNREGIAKFKTGVKTLERKLKPLYTIQKNLLVKASKFDLEDIPETLKIAIDKNNNAITELVKDGIGGRIKPITVNVDTLEVYKGDTKISKTLGMGFVDKPMSEIQFPNKKNNFVGSEDDAIIKANLAEQILTEASNEGLIDYKKGKPLIQKFFQQGASPTVVTKAKGRFVPIAAMYLGGAFVGSQVLPLFTGTPLAAAEVQRDAKGNIIKPEVKQPTVGVPLKYDATQGSIVNANTDQTADQNQILEYVKDNPLKVTAGTSLGFAAQEVPGAYKAARDLGRGRVRSALGISGALRPVLTTFGTPLLTGLYEGAIGAKRLEEGETMTDVLTDPLGPALGVSLMEPLSKLSGVVKDAPKRTMLEGARNYFNLSNVGAARPGITGQILRMGMSPRMIAGASRFLGLPGLALGLGMAGYDAYKNYQNQEGMIYNLFNKNE
jgi:hypothetical protein